MAIKTGKLLISILFFVFLVLSVGCASIPDCSACNCPECNCPPCDEGPSKLEVCQECDYAELGCVDVDEVNSLLNLTNKLIVIYNNISGQEPINELDYYEKIEVNE